MLNKLMILTEEFLLDKDTPMDKKTMKNKKVRLIRYVEKIPITYSFSK